MANFLQMAQKVQKLKAKTQEMQERVQRMDLQGSAGGGLVTCVVSGKHELKSLKINPSLIKVEEAEVMEDLIIAAVNDARQRAEKVMEEETRKLMSELGLPPGMDLPF